MPTYLLHGFRWPRPLIRIHIILQNLDDAAAEWLCAPGTTTTMIENFQEIFPDTMKDLPQLRFIEQYDPEDLSPGSGSQPYAYVADIVHEVRLGLDVDEVRGKGVSNDQWGSILELRDKLAPEEKVGWYIVVCGDEERYAPEEEEPAQNGYTYNVPYSPPTQPSAFSPVQQHLPYRSTSDARSVRTVDARSVKTSDARSILTSSTDRTRKEYGSPELPQKGFKKFVGVLTRRKSRQSMRDLQSSGSMHSFDAPPVPALPAGISAANGNYR